MYKRGVVIADRKLRVILGYDVMVEDSLILSGKVFDVRILFVFFIRGMDEGEKMRRYGTGCGVGVCVIVNFMLSVFIMFWMV